MKKTKLPFICIIRVIALSSYSFLSVNHGMESLPEKQYPLARLSSIDNIAREETTFLLESHLTFRNEGPFDSESLFEYGNALSPDTVIFSSKDEGYYDLSFQFDLSGEEYLSAITLGSEEYGGGTLIFHKLGNILFSGNASRENGGAASSYTHILLATEIDSGINFADIRGEIRFTGNRSDGDGGALYAFTSIGNGVYESKASGFISFTDITGDLLFDGNRAAGSGGAMYSYQGSSINLSGSVSNTAGGIHFLNIAGGISFIENIALGDGGALFSQSVSDSQSVLSNLTTRATTNGSVRFNGITGHLTFSLNSAGNNGGAIGQVNETLSLTKGGECHLSSEILFSSITGSISFLSNSAGNYGGGISSYLSSVVSYYVSTRDSLLFESVNGDILFQNNYSDGGGGAIGMTGDVLNESQFYLEGKLLFHNINGDVSFEDNYTKGSGGAILSSYSLLNTNGSKSETHVSLEFQNINGSLLFLDNNATLYGGAIAVINQNTVIGSADTYSSNTFIIGNIQGDVIFESNHSMTNGGAVYAENSCVSLSADGGSMIFAGNTSGEGTSKLANAFFLVDKNSYISTLRAKEGRSIIFHDPVVMSNYSDQILHLNAPDITGSQDYEGTILFTGRGAAISLVQEEGENDDQYASRLANSRSSEINQDAILYGGVLHVTEQATVTFNSLEIRRAELITTEGGLIRASRIHFDNALIDINRVMAEGSLNLDVTTLSGSLAIYNKDGTLYSEGGSLQASFSIPILTLVSEETDYSGFSLILNDESSGKSEGFYHGYWSLVWEDGNPDDTNTAAHILYAVWNYTGSNEIPGPEPETFTIDKERKGDEAANSLWIARSNLDSFAHAAFSQMSPLRFQTNQDHYLWAMALGDFRRQRSTDSANGFDYWGGGYAVGADTKINSSFLTGVAFGQLLGTSQGKDFNTKADHDSRMIMLYASWLTPLKKENHHLRVDAVAAYGVTSNRSNIHYLDGKSADGRWDSNSLNIAARMHLDIKWDDSLYFSPFAGLEYCSSKLDDFTETGTDTRHFDESKLRSMRLPLGISLTKITSLGDNKVFARSVAVSYIPEFFRDNEGARVQKGDTNWKTYGSNVSRQACRVDLSGRLQLNASWSVYAAYRLTFSEDNLGHQVNAGVSYAF